MAHFLYKVALRLEQPKAEDRLVTIDLNYNAGASIPVGHVGGHITSNLNDSSLLDKIEELTTSQRQQSRLFASLADLNFGLQWSYKSRDKTLTKTIGKS